MRRFIVPLALVSAFGLSACGSEVKSTLGESEGDYVRVGALEYQVQISRQLNAKGTEDRRYLSGLPPADQGLAADETWFAIFLRVKNHTEKPHPSAEAFAIEDTVGTEYRPIGIQNSYAYKAQLVGAQLQLPDLNSPNYLSPTQGELLLFKVKYSSLANRPLEFTIEDPSAKPDKALIELDV